MMRRKIFKRIHGKFAVSGKKVGYAYETLGKHKKYYMGRFGKGTSQRMHLKKVKKSHVVSKY